MSRVPLSQAIMARLAVSRAAAAAAARSTTTAIFPHYALRKALADCEGELWRGRKLLRQGQRLGRKMTAHAAKRELAKLGPKPWRHKTRRASRAAHPHAER